MLTPSKILLPLAFVVAGLKEVGEPAREALIVDLAEKSHKGRSIRLYYSIREGVIIPALLFGAFLWHLSHKIMFLTAFIIRAIGVLIIFTLVKIEEQIMYLNIN